MSDVNVTPEPQGGAPATPTAPTPAAATPAVPAVSATPATPQVAPPSPATDGDRSGWVPPHRIRETREAAIREAQQQFAQREQALQAQLQQVQQQIRALVGVQPPQNPEQDAIRQQFAQLFPGLAKLEEKHSDLIGILERAGDFEQSTNHYWQSHGRQAMDRLFNLASQTSGGNPISDDAKRQLHSAFIGYVQSSPELTERYISDPTIVDDFWKAFTASFIDPARRAAVSAPAARVGAPIPQDTPSGAPRTSPAPSPSNMDEMMKQAWALYNQNAK